MTYIKEDTTDETKEKTPGKPLVVARNKGVDKGREKPLSKTTTLFYLFWCLALHSSFYLAKLPRMFWA